MRFPDPGDGPRLLARAGVERLSMLGMAQFGQDTRIGCLKGSQRNSRQQKQSETLHVDRPPRTGQSIQVRSAAWPPALGTAIDSPIEGLTRIAHLLHHEIKSRYR
jgi:hypothetical protein